LVLAEVFDVGEVLPDDKQFGPLVAKPLRPVADDRWIKLENAAVA